MRQATYDWLSLLHGQFGPREFGKLCQKLLAISFRRAGYTHVTERGVQGVDVDAADGQVKYTTEVKTTLGKAILFQAKDASGLADRQADGYQPILGVLRLSPLADWLLADAVPLPVGRLELERLRPYRNYKLEESIRLCFAAVVEEHAEAALMHAQAYLDRVLRQMGVVVKGSD